MRRSGRSDAAAPVTRVTAALLRRWPLPRADGEGDKEERGRVLVVGGAPAMPGPVILAAIAALRAGAGKLQIAVGKSLQATVGGFVPEAFVMALPEGRSGAIPGRAAAMIAEAAAEAQAVLIGPGMVGDPAPLLRGLLPRLARAGAPLVLDALPLAHLAHARTALHPLGGRVVLTPHAGEMAKLMGMEKREVLRDAPAVARRAARELGAVIALKGADTFIAEPGGAVYLNRGRNAGLGTSGSGDTLAGIVAGLVARGCEPLQGAIWGVHLHAAAGAVLARRLGPLGFLAREILAEVPPLMARASEGRPRG
jgi:ADP-dependent NAD(P)H-hydrate dehydratase